MLQHLLKPILKHIPAHLNNTADLISRFQEVPIEDLKNKIPVSFDVVSLYTNINAHEAIYTTLEYARKSKIYLYGLELENLWDLLHLLLENNIFS